MATITPQPAVRGGSDLTWTAATAAGDAADDPTSNLVVLVDNGSGGSIDVTLVMPDTTWSGGANPDVVVAVANGAIGMVRLDARYRDGNGQATWTYSSDTSVNVAVVAVG